MCLPACWAASDRATDAEGSDPRRAALLGKRQQLRAVFSDRQCMLELRRQRAVRGADDPLIGHDANGCGACVDHGFDRKDHTRLDAHPRAGRAEVQHRGVRLVERPPNAMAGQLADNRESLRFGVALNGRPDVAQVLAWLRLLDAKLQAAIRHIHQSLRLRRDLPHGHGFAGVATPAAVEHADIDSDDIPLAQLFPGAGDAMADDVVDRCADRAWERRARWTAAAGWLRAVALIHRECSSAEDEFLREAVELSGGHAGLDVRP